MGQAAKKDDKEMNELTREMTILNRMGLHARPAAMFVKISNAHKAEVWVEKDGEQVNGKSIMGLMMLAAGAGSKLRVTARGTDAPEVLKDLEALLARKFGEE
ncbi:MAG: HPr family phosphocarrier protein [Verrucomicrobiae bacterium]|nr:HPr family phosphocarrier protein [Verrucomicrobiae bacterium]